MIRLASLLTVVVAHVACKKAEPLPLAVTFASAQDLAFDVQTAPGALVSCHGQGSKNADAEGKARVVVPAGFLNAGKQTVRCTAETLNPDRRGYAEIEVFVPTLLRVEAGKIVSCVRRKCTGRIEWSDKVTVIFDLLEKASFVELGTTRVPVTATRGFRVSAPLGLGGKLATTKIADLLADSTSLRVEVPLKVTFAGEGTVATTVRGGRDAYLGAIAHEVRAREKSHGARPGRSAGGPLLLTGVVDPKLFGKAERVADLGRVAVATWAWQYVPCGMYKSPSPRGGSRRLQITRTNYHVVVHDYRTGTKLAEKTLFAPYLACPTWATSRGGVVNEKMSTSAAPAQVYTWLAGLAR
jgi:hypothetical protein